MKWPKSAFRLCSFVSLCISRDWRAIGRKSGEDTNPGPENQRVEKILFVLFIIIVYRIGSFIPTPGVDYNVVNKCMATIGSASRRTSSDW